MSAPIDPDAMSALSDADLRGLLAAAIKSYAARVEASDEPLAALEPHSGVTATEAMLAVSAIMKAVNVQVFELGMWQSWSGR
ncbi:MAG: hypothetical protein ABWY35_05240 [Pseudorhodoplanes sp.]